RGQLDQHPTRLREDEIEEFDEVGPEGVEVAVGHAACRYSTPRRAPTRVGCSGFGDAHSCAARVAASACQASGAWYIGSRSVAPKRWQRGALRRGPLHA